MKGFNVLGSCLAGVVVFLLAPVAPATPITGGNILVVDGVEWAQVDLFDNLSWNDINAVCPSGVCIDDGELNGYTMTGWLWADWEDVQPMFNSYLSAAGVTGDDLLGPGAHPAFGDSYVEQASTWAPEFFASGWRPTVSSATGFQYAMGLTRQLVLGTEVSVAFMHWSNDGQLGDAASTSLLFTDNLDSAEGGRGAWFLRRDPQPGVPAPATLALFSVGFAGLFWFRRKRA